MFSILFSIDIDYNGPVYSNPTILTEGYDASARKFNTPSIV